MGDNAKKVWKLRALTDIWTGDAHRRSDRLIPTGIMGSLRWWYEVLVRGLDGKACDPTAKEVRCPQDSRKKPADPGHHCVVCELFGCTGWTRKFRLMILDENGQVIQNQIKADQEFTLSFIPLRPISDEEWCLLDLTLRLIADYGAIGGKTIFKLSDEPNRQNRPYHKDYGLIQYEEIVTPENWTCTKSLEDLKRYVSAHNWRQYVPYNYRENGEEHDYSWVSLQNFWCVRGRYLARQDANTSSFNFVIGRPEPKSQSSQGDSWLAGRRPNRRRGIEPESKKVFSFKNPARTFGFVQNQDEFQAIIERLKVLRDGNGNGRKPDPEWKGFDPTNDFLIGEQILEQLFSREGSA